MDLGLNGKVALVTAASRGIGRAIADRLAAEGATVAVSARKPENLGPGQHAYPVDLSDAAAVERLVPEVLERHGGLDVLVVNTPGPRVAPFLDTTLADWSHAYDQLVRPAVQLASAGARAMVERGGGSILFITSVWVKQVNPGGVLSASMRSAVSALAKQMSQELARHNIRVNQLLPGATATDRMRSMAATRAAADGITEEEAMNQIARGVPLGRWAEPEEVAGAAVYLVSPAAAFITGQALAADGGSIRSVL